MQWGNFGSGGSGAQAPFRFGPLSGIQQTLYENQQDIPYQQFTDWFGGGNAAFQNTVMGRWLNSQQSTLNNRFLQRQAANPSGGLTWTSFLEEQAPQMAAQFQSLPGYMRGSNPAGFRIRRELW